MEAKEINNLDLKEQLFLNIENDNIEEVKKIIKAIDTIAYNSATFRTSPLKFACLKNKTEIVKLLLNTHEDCLYFSFTPPHPVFLISLLPKLQIFDLVLEHAEEMTKQLFLSEKKITFLTLTLLGEVYFALGHKDTNKQPEYFDKLKQVYNRIFSTNLGVYFHLMMASGFHKDGNFSDASEHYEKATELSKNFKEDLQALVCKRYGEYLYQTNEISKAEIVYKQSYKIFNSNQNELPKAVTLINLIQCMFTRLDNLPLLNTYLSVAEKIFTQFKCVPYLTHYHLLKSIYYSFSNNHESAIKEARKVFAYTQSGEHFTSATWLIALNYCKIGNSEKSEKYFKQLPNAFFDFLSKEVVFEIKPQISPQAFIKQFDIAKKLLIEAIVAKDNHKIKILMLNFVILAVNFVAVYCKSEYSDLFQEYWDFYSHVTLMCIDQKPEEIKKLYQHCIIPYNILFCPAPPILYAIVEHIYHTVLIVTGNNLRTDFIQTKEMPWKNHLCLSFNSEKGQMIFTLVNLGVAEKTSSQFLEIFPNLHLSINLIKVFLHYNYVSIEPPQNELSNLIFNHNALEIQDQNDFIFKRILWFRDSLIAYYNPLSAIIDININDQRSVCIPEHFFLVMMHIYLNLVLYCIQKVEDSSLKKRFEQICLLAKNITPTKNDYGYNWIKEFNREISSKFLLNETIYDCKNDKLNSLIIVVIEVLFLTCCHIRTKRTHFEIVEPEIKEVAFQVIKSYRALNMVTVSDYKQEFDFASIEANFNLSYAGLIIKLSDEEITAVLKEALEKRNFIFTQLDNHSFEITFFRTQGKIKGLGHTLKNLIYEKKNKDANNVATISLVRSVSLSEKDDVAQELDTTELKQSKRSSTSGKKTKKELKTELIRSKINAKKKPEKDDKNDNFSKSKFKEKNENKQIIISESSQVQSCTQIHENIEIIINNPNPDNPFSGVIEKISPDQPKEYPQWINKKLLKIALNHGKQLRSVLSDYIQGNSNLEDLLHVFLYHAIRMLHAIAMCHHNKLLEPYVNIEHVRFYRNILLHRYDYFFRKHHSHLLISKNKEALIYLLIEKILPFVDQLLANGEIHSEKILLEEHSLFQIFSPYNVLKLPAISTNELFQWICCELEDIRKSVISIQSPQDKLNDNLINKIKMRLVKIGCVAKTLRARDLNFCNNNFSSSLQPESYGLKVIAFLQSNSKIYEEFKKDVSNPKAFPILKQLTALTSDSIEKLLNLFQFSDFLSLCIEVRKTVGHNFFSPSFVDKIFNQFDEISNHLVCDIALCASHFVEHAKVLYLKTSTENKQVADVNDDNLFSIEFG